MTNMTNLSNDPVVAPKTEQQAPFLIEHGQSEVSNGGYFTPVAHLIVQPALRTSGLLAALPDREAKSLLLLLTFLTANGRIEPTTAQLADALHLPECVVRSRMGKLTAFRWQGERIVRHAFKDSGVDGYRISRSVVAEREAPNPPTATVASPEKTYPGGEAVIAHSRAAYGRPRADVEKEIARQFGAGLGTEGQPDTAISSEEAEARRQLLSLGVSPIQADRLIAEHPISVIQDKLVWLPDRAARSPARYIVRAIDERYDPPPRVRLERAIAAAEQQVNTNRRTVETTVTG